MPRRKRKRGARQQPKHRNKIATALARPLYRQRVKPGKLRETLVIEWPVIEDGLR